MPSNDPQNFSASNDEVSTGVTPASPAPAEIRRAREWEPGKAPGFSEEFRIKPVQTPTVGTAEYNSCVDLIKRMQVAHKRALAAATAETRFQIVARMASSLVGRLDGRHAGLPLVELDMDDPLYQLALAARRVTGCLMFGKGKYHSPETAKRNIAAQHWEQPMSTDVSDIREEALQTFHELTKLIVDELTLQS